MRLTSIVAFAFLALAAPGYSRPHSPSTTHTPTGFCGADSYVNVNGHCVHRPVQAERAPAGASARCRDGSYSFSENRRGTCSHHGGVAEWL